MAEVTAIAFNQSFSFEVPDMSKEAGSTRAKRSCKVDFTFVYDGAVEGKFISGSAGD